MASTPFERHARGRPIRWRRTAAGLGGALFVVGLMGCSLSGGAGDQHGSGPEPTLATVTSVPAALNLETLTAASPQGDPVPLRLEVLDTYPADPTTFTQGLEYGPDGRVFASSGLYGASWVGVVDPETGQIQQRRTLDPTWFAEGLTLVATPRGPELLLLTWREGVAVFLDPVTLAERRRVRLEGEGWGVCDLGDGTVAVSDGTSSLTFRSTVDFSVTRVVEVTRSGRPVNRLNELECRGGLVWANVWMTSDIVAIDPSTGRVVGELNVAELTEPQRARGADVLNGIAAIPTTPDEFLLAGKRWTTTHRVRISTP